MNKQEAQILGSLMAKLTCHF